jgi:histidine triad (HIT) family protein
MDCIFCKIVNKEIPANIVYEDEHVLAFLDITQGTKGHTLVIPKTHSKNILETDQTTLTHVFTATQKIAQAIKEAFHPIGLNILNNTDKPLQSVFHFHVHIIPRYENDGVVIRTDNNHGKHSQDELSSTAKQIANKLD